MHPPAGVVEKQVTKGIEPKSQVSIVFTGPFQNDEMHRVMMQRDGRDARAATCSATLREDLGGTYGVSVEPNFTKRPTEEYRLTISFACDPARTREPGQGGVPGHRARSRMFGPTREPGRRRACGAGARFRNEQPAERLPAEPPRLQVPVRRGRQGRVQHAGVLRPDHVADAARRRAHVSEHEPVRESHAAARRRTSARTRWQAT